MFSFNIDRFRAVFVREFYLSFKNAINILGVLALANISLLTLAGIFGDGLDSRQPILTNFAIMFLIVGFILASISFYEFRKTSEKAEFLALPASSLEKVLVKLIYSGLFYAILLSILYFALGLISTSFLSSIRGHEYEIGIFNSKNYWTVVGLFFIIHSVFFFGSVAFDKFSLIKTLLVLVILALVVGIIGLIWFRIVFAEYFAGNFFKPDLLIESNMDFGINYRDPSEMPQVKLLIFCFKYIMAPVLWVASIFKLSEKEL